MLSIGHSPCTAESANADAGGAPRAEEIIGDAQELKAGETWTERGE